MSGCCLYHLGLVVSLFALDDILGRDSALGQIDVTLLLVDSQNNDNLISSDADQLLDTSDTSSGQFAEQDHAVDVVVFKQLDVCSHLGNLRYNTSVYALGETESATFPCLSSPA